MHKQQQDWQRQDWVWLIGFWLLSAIADGIWLWWDTTPPAHDQGDHFSRALAMYQVTLQPNWSWADLWPLAPGYRGPLVYLATLPLWHLIGAGLDQGVVVNLGFHALLLVATYALGSALCDRRVGLWSAGLVGFLPWIAFIRVDYWLDYGLTTCVTLAYWCFARWRRGSPLWAIAAGVTTGCVILAKFTGVLLVITPAIALLVIWLWQRRWGRLLQWLGAAAIAIAMILPWLRANWLTLVGASNQSISTAPSVGGWQAAGVYAVILTDLVTPVLVLAAIVGGLWGWRQGYWQRHRYDWAWWWLCLGGTYLLFTLIRNRHIRHIMPLTPLVLVGVVAAVLALPRGRWFTVACVSLLYSLHLWLPWPALALRLSPEPWVIAAIPRAPQHQTWPHREVMASLQARSPNVDSLVGVTTNTYAVNPFTLNAYGQLADFQIVTRELGFQPETLVADSLAMPYYISKTGDQGPYESLLQAQAQLRDRLANEPSLALVETWPLPDGSDLQLYARTPPPVSVTLSASASSALQLAEVQIPDTLTTPLAITYVWSGDATVLSDAPVLISWENAAGDRWLHDHAIGLGRLRLTGGDYRVTENLALALPIAPEPGEYRLRAEVNGQRLAVPPVAIVIPEPSAALPRADLLPDPLAQVRTLGAATAAGDLDTVFQRVGQLNQYDDRYLAAAEKTLAQRWQAESQTLEWGYALGLVQTLQFKSEAALATFGSLSQRDPDNPYAWGYSALIHLYNWQPRQAQPALEAMARLAPDDQAYEVLSLASAVMRFDLGELWQRL